MSDAAEQLVAHRPMLFGLAYRLLGSVHDAEDVLQEAYLRWSRADRAAIALPRRYLTRVVTRLALDQLRIRQTRRESYIGPWLPEPLPTADLPVDEVEQHESLSMALLHLMERLSPPERAVYVLRTAFDLPYADIAEALDRTPPHCRQLYRRAAAALESDQRRFTADQREHERLLGAFVAAARNADLATLRRLLHADVIAWTDGGGQVRAARNGVYGTDKVARFFAGIYGRDACSLRMQNMELNGTPALLVSRSTTTHALLIAVSDGQIIGVYLVSNPQKLQPIQLHGLFGRGSPIHSGIADH